MLEGLYSNLLLTAGSAVRADLAAQGFSQSSLENLQGGRLHSHLGQPVPLLDHVQGEKESCSPACHSPDCFITRAVCGNSMKSVYRKERG